MASQGISPRVAVIVGALALVPVAIYGMTSSALAGVTAAVNVFLIIGGLWLATSAVGEGEDLAPGSS